MARTIQLIDPKIQPEDLIIPARNARGETERQWFKCSPDLDRVLATIHASKKFPWKTIGDQIRCYVHHGAKWAEKAAGVTTGMQLAEAMHVLLRREEEQQRYRENIELARKVLDRYVADGDHAEARRTLAECRALVLQMPAGHLRTKYTKTLDETFGHLLEGKRHAVSLRHFRKPDTDEAGDE